MLPISELEWEAGDGTIYPLLYPGRHLMEISGLGMPPIQHWTTRSPFQHGETHWGYAWQPRIVNLVLYSQGGNRTCLYYQRQDTIAAFNPALGPGKLRLTYPDGQAFELHECRFNSDYKLSSADGTHTTQIGSMQLRVSDPFWKWVTAPLNAGETRDAEGRSCVVDDSWTTTSQLRLPFSGPYLLGTTTGTNALTITNSGTVSTKPVITMEGPIYDWVLSNATNGDFLIWNGYAIAAGETVTIDIPAKTCTSDVSGDVSTYLSGDTGSFSLDAGVNTLNAIASGGVITATTTIGVCWYLEVLGI